MLNNMWADSSALAGVRSVFLDLVAEEPELIVTHIPLVKPADQRIGKKQTQTNKIQESKKSHRKSPARLLISAFLKPVKVQC